MFFCTFGIIFIFNSSVFKFRIFSGNLIYGVWMDKDVIILLVNGFCVIVTVYCFVSDYYVIALVGICLLYTSDAADEL